MDDYPDNDVPENEKRKLQDELRNMMVSGCTCTELVRFVEACLGSKIKPLTLIDMISEAFDVHAGYIVAARNQPNPLDSSILNATILTKIVANRNAWQSRETAENCWMDYIYSDPPAILLDSIAESTETVPPCGISIDGWDALPESDKSQLLTISRSYHISSYRVAVLAVLCEQLQWKLHQLQHDIPKNEMENPKPE
ncbi:hypothetical protein [Gimesia chilikensis]|uniref:hypothetical protein n=1 Tax=Gimesia chilikensis TaxID=2605989 RepID=UPI003A92C0F1